MSRFEVKEAGLDQLETLMAWRMEVLHEVFSGSDPDWQALEKANREYYRHQIPAGGHIAVFLKKDGEIIGCGGLCLQQEMPSPDNPTGGCGYLMNIYTRPAFRQEGGAEKTVEYLIGRAREKGCRKIYLETSDAGRNLYHSLGFQDMKDYLKL